MLHSICSFHLYRHGCCLPSPSSSLPFLHFDWSSIFNSHHIFGRFNASNSINVLKRWEHWKICFRLFLSSSLCSCSIVYFFLFFIVIFSSNSHIQFSILLRFRFDEFRFLYFLSAFFVSFLLLMSIVYVLFLSLFCCSFHTASSEVIWQAALPNALMRRLQ